MIARAIQENTFFLPGVYIQSQSRVLKITPFLPKFSEIQNQSIYVQQKGSLNFSFYDLVGNKYD